MKRFNILGCGKATLSMIVETLFRIFGRETEVHIIKNIDVRDDTPYQITGMGFKEIHYKDWKLDSSAGIIIGLMKPENKIKVYKFFKKSHNIHFNDYKSLLYPGIHLAESSIIGRGLVTNPGLVVGPYADIGDIVSINRNVSIGHHSRISDFCTINPGVNIAGFVEVGEATTIGMGTNILEHIKIGKNVIVGAGSVVTKDIPDNVIAYGSPAKIIREKEL